MNRLRASLFLIIGVWLGSPIQTMARDEIPTYAQIRALVEERRITSPLDLLRALPDQLVASFLLFHKSYTFPEDARLVSLRTPRVVLFSWQGNSFLALAFIKGSSKVEVVEWNFSKAAFEPHLIDFGRRAVVFDHDLQRCLGCHSYDLTNRALLKRAFRLNWDTYSFWPTTFGAIDNTSDDGGFNLQSRIEEPHIEALGSDPFYRVFFEALYRVTPRIIGYSEPSAENFNASYLELTQANQVFGYAANDLNARRMVADINELDPSRRLLTEILEAGKEASIKREIPSSDLSRESRERIFQQSKAGLELLKEAYGEEAYDFSHLSPRVRYEEKFFTAELARRFDLQYIERISQLASVFSEFGIPIENYSSSFTSPNGKIERLPLFFDGGTSIIDRVHFLASRESCDVVGLKE